MFAFVGCVVLVMFGVVGMFLLCCASCFVFVKVFCVVRCLLFVCCMLCNMSCHLLSVI